MNQSHETQRNGFDASFWRRFVLCFPVIVLVFGSSILLASKADDPLPEFRKCWEYKSTPNLAVPPAVDGATIYFLNSDAQLEALDLATGTRAWSSEIGGEVVSNLHAADGALYAVTSTPVNGDPAARKLTLRSFSGRSGVANWNIDLPSATHVWLEKLGSSTVAITSAGEGFAFGNEKGDVLWRTTLGGAVTSEPYHRGTSLVIGTDRKEVVSLEGSTGKLTVIARGEHDATAALVDQGNRYLMGDSRGNIVFGSAGNVSWRFKHGAQISYLMTYDSEYLAASHDNFIYKLTRDGDVEWKRRLSGRVSARPVVVGRALVVTASGAGTVYVMDLGNGKVVNRLEAGDEGATAIAAGAGFVLNAANSLTYFTADKCSTTK